MQRPDIEETKEYIKNHCGIPIKKRAYCEDFGCSSMLELIEYIEFLEKLVPTKN